MVPGFPCTSKPARPTPRAAPTAANDSSCPLTTLRLSEVVAVERIPHFAHAQGIGTAQFAGHGHGAELDRVGTLAKRVGFESVDGVKFEDEFEQWRRALGSGAGREARCSLLSGDWAGGPITAVTATRAATGSSKHPGDRLYLSPSETETASCAGPSTLLSPDRPPTGPSSPLA